MDVVLSWLNDLAPFGEDAEALATSMNHLGMAVEAVRTVGSSIPGVITARVVRTERHPEAAKVHRVWVDAGDGAERHVWCGAFNMEAGDVIPLATPGTEMPDGRRIEPRPILGINSEGMLCSARELGLGDDHSGILILPADTPLGLPYGQALGLSQHVVFELDLTRNRPDCWGHLGVARDLAAHLGVGMDPATPDVEATGNPIECPVTIVDGDRCGRFTATVISGVHVGESPQWMKDRLIAAGMRPINNVVDISNYVMLELNQPNHAYDLATLGGGGFRVRRAGAGESMTTLDGTVRSLIAEDLLICDAHDVSIGIAGIMGGLDSEISAATTTVALEIAWFEPTGIGATGGRLGLRSEASARFERGVDPYGMDRSIARFVELLGETCPTLVVHRGATDARADRLPAQRRSVAVRLARVNAILGISIRATALPALLDGIGLTVDLSSPVEGASDEGLSDEVVTVTLPSWRPDCTGEIDVIEEIARHYGYDRIGKTVPKSTVHGRLSPNQQRRRNLRQVLLGLGLSEAMPNPFLAPGDLDRAGLITPAISITNPLVAEESVLRTSLRPGLLKAVAYNASHRRTGVSLFEVGHVFPPGAGQLPDEFEGLGVVLAGRQASAAVAVWKELASALSLGARVDQGTIPAGLHPTRSATLSLGRDVVGALGEVHPDVCEAYGITERVAVLELNLSVLLTKEPAPAKWKPTSRYPSSDLDLAFVTPDDVPADKVDRAIRQGAGGLLADLRLFDVYRGAGVPEGARSLAYRVRLQAPDRTLTDADLTQVRDRVLVAASKLKAALRS